MDLSAALPREVMEALERGTIVLTGNQRAARGLRHAFDLHQGAAGKAYWEPPAIFAWDAWLADLWHRMLLEGRATDLLLNSAQEEALWREAIAADDSIASLRPVDALAETAVRAWQLLHAYRGRRHLQTYAGNSDTRAFARWVGDFERHRKRSQYLTQAQLPESLRVAIGSGCLTLRANFLLVGFDFKTPAQMALLDAIRAAGLAVDDLQRPQFATSLTLAAARDEDDELTACARWLRDRLTRRPSSRIAVIVPAMDICRSEIDRVFRRILAPELDDIATSAGAGPYEFSLGVALSQTPLVAAALDTLRWMVGSLPLERIGALLLSPYFAASEAASSMEFLARAEFDAFVLRDQNLLQPEMSLDALYAIVGGSKHRAGLVNLHQHLATLRPLFLAQKSAASAKRAHADWAAVIHDVLDAAGWALASGLDSIEFQTRRKWEGALDELATLDFDGARITFAEALTALERIASGTLFAPESRHAPIQVMGPLESAGSSFDAVWFLRANDLSWPSTPATNPLLPWHLQRELGMPGADPALDSDHARRITERIAGSGQGVLFSYAKESSEGRQRPSSSLSGMELEVRDVLEVAPEGPVRARVELDSAIDDAPIPAPPDDILQGGAGILRSQAACGFRAFAEKRLFSSALDTATLGLDALERGNIVHAVLENFWAEVQSQAALRRMTRPDREVQINRSIDVALARDHSGPAPGWPRAYLAAERRRLINLLHSWLDYEANQRAPFTVQSREEMLQDVRIGPLRLNVRVDRIDRVELEDAGGDGGASAGEIILDYKTGPAIPAQWLGPRPDAPQLPLYAVVSNMPHLAGVAFANVRPGKDAVVRGYEAQDGLLPNKARLQTESLEAQVDEWREALTLLAQDFYSGEASVSPKSYPQTCAMCEQRLFCRLDVSTLDADAVDDSELESDLFHSVTTSLEADHG